MQRGTALAIGGLIAITIIGIFGWPVAVGFLAGFMTSEVSAYIAYGRWRD